MYLKAVQITNFRNYDNLKITLSNRINIIYGSNGQGKTNLLESLYVLGMTKSHRSYIDHSLIKSDKKQYKIKGTIVNNSMHQKLEIIYNTKEKKLKIDNNDIKKISDYISKMNIIIFYPDDLILIKGSPFERRRFLNSEISQLSSNYLIIINDYNKLLKMRNEYLKKDVIDNKYLDILTSYLIDKAVIIYKMRYKFITKLNDTISEIYKNLSNLDNFRLIYKTSLTFNNYEKEYLKEELFKYFQKNRKKELKQKQTLIGPHRDDFNFFISNNNLRTVGSQGQQRLAVLSLKLAEINIIKNYRGGYPILLLDDVFSELDKKKKNSLLRYLNNDIQTIITTTDLSNINKKLRNQAKLIKIKKGTIEKITEVN